MNYEEPHRSLQPLILLLCAVGASLFTNPALAQTPPKDVPSSGSQPKHIAPLGAGDMVQAAANLRKASESFERFGNSLERVTTALTKGLVESSENLAIMSSGFDPLGLKHAFATIQRQTQTIQSLHEAETERLRKECAKLKKKISRLKKKTKQRKQPVIDRNEATKKK